MGESTRKLVPGIGGIDEAGRGPLAGPVVAAAVILLPGQRIEGVRDSKLLSAAKRERLAIEIRTQAVAWSIGIAQVDEIDTLNILHATMLAMRRAVESLPCPPERLRFDGNRAPELSDYNGSTETVIGGDRTCPAIAAASILAKVYRDDVMDSIDLEFPEYGFAKHKGYPTARHRDALMEYGPCPVHRRSFRPVRLAIARHRTRS